MNYNLTIADITLQILKKYNKTALMHGEYDLVKEIYDKCVRSRIMKSGKIDLSDIQHLIFSGLDQSNKFKKVIGLGNKRIFVFIKFD